jgi:gliding motility-associated lipoprotein GldD
VALLFIIALSGLLVASCAEETYTPKPRGYFRIDLPERIYADFRSDYCPCTFTYPAYGAIERKTSFFDEKPDHPCWMNIDMPYFNGKLHMSYMEIRPGDKLERVINDSYKYAFKHSIKADFIDETTISEEDLYAVLFDIGGNVASSVQFFATDSSEHYLRGSLYFNEQPNADSLQPVIDFIRDDILALMRSIEWEG